MTLIRRSSPFGDLLTLRHAMDRAFDDSFFRPRAWQAADGPSGGALPIDAYAGKDALVVKAALPGIKPDDVEITIEGDTLTISGTFNDERKEEEGGYLFQELRRGTWSRTVTLPSDLDTEAATAEFEHGVLTLTLPRSEKARPRQIKVTATSHASANGVEAGTPAGAR